MREVHWVGNPMAPKQGNALNKRNEGRGVTSARLRFWHDVCPYTLQNYSIKLHFKLLKLTKILSKIR
jgi:hypothetical protein